VAPDSDAANVKEPSLVVTVPFGPPLIVVSGAARSILIVTDRCVVSPAPFVAAQVTVVPAVSADSVAASHPLDDEIPETASDTLHATPTLPTYQPFVPAVPVTDTVISGALESYLNIATADADRPAPFAHEPLTDASLVSGPA
jgi:hypothetical protein